MPNNSAGPGSPAPKRGPISQLLKKKWFIALCIMLMPFIVLALSLWYIAGVLLTMPTIVVSTLATVTTWTLYLSLPGIPLHLLDWPIIFTVAYVAMTSGNIDNSRTNRSLHLTMCVALAAYSICRSELLHPIGDSTTHSLLTTMTVFGCILPFWVAVCRLRLWLPADEKVLEEMERTIYNKYMVNGYNAHKVAGLGTVHVPYCGEDTRLASRTLVLVHGYFAGNAFWAANLPTLSKYFNVYAVEWKGIGRSNRPTFKPKTEEEKDAFFVESLEEWRRTMQLDRFTLLGHSMGGMYTTYYSEKYPQHVEHLILVSPAGVTLSEEGAKYPWFIQFCAKRYITPMSLIRFAGPFGLSLVQWAIRKRVEWTAPTNVIRSGEMDVHHITAYCYHNWALKASGDIAIFTHLGPMVRAQRRPLCDVLSPATIKVPVTFLYGGEDWMPREFGEAVVRKLEKTHYAAFRLVPGAGHQVFMDNPHDFNHMVIAAVHEYEQAISRIS